MQETKSQFFRQQLLEDLFDASGPSIFKGRFKLPVFYRKNMPADEAHGLEALNTPGITTIGDRLKALNIDLSTEDD